MFSPYIILVVVSLYMFFLVIVAYIVEKNEYIRNKLIGSPIIYSLSLATYCTAWTFYGSIGKAIDGGMLSLSFYIGATLIIILWWIILRKMVYIKNAFKTTSIADFISVRYNKSQYIAIMATVMAFFAIVPYIAIQLKAIYTSLHILMPVNSGGDEFSTRYIEYIITMLLILFTILFGVRRLDLTERHPGMVVALAIESMVKLTAFLFVGIFVTYFLFDGFNDILEKFVNSSWYYKLPWIKQSSIVEWNVYLTLSMGAVIFLPRQFHIGVIENSNEKHIKIAMWLFPLYMFLLSIFIFPVALGGLLKGYLFSQADKFTLLLPAEYGQPWLVLLVFLGGFSAAAGMIMLSTIAMATMLSNHFLLPLIEWNKRLKGLKKHLLKCRWLFVALMIFFGHWFEMSVGKFYTLVDMGMIAFAGVFQFVPASLGGLFWRKGNKTGASLGLTAGFFIWFYTSLFPAIVKTIAPSTNILENGLFGIGFLNPEKLFGIQMTSSLINTVFWSTIFNVGFYIIGSLYLEPTEEEQKITNDFIDALHPTVPLNDKIFMKSNVNIPEKRKIIIELFKKYFTPQESEKMAEKCILPLVELSDSKKIQAIKLIELSKEVEKFLAGAIGAASAYKEVSECVLLTKEESEEISMAYSHILTDLKITPNELREKINYYQEKEDLLNHNAAILQKKVEELQTEINKRITAETALAVSNANFSSIVEKNNDGILIIDNDQIINFINPAVEIFFNDKKENIINKPINFKIPSGFENLSEIDILRKNGEPGKGELSMIETEWKNKKAYLLTLRDISERKKAEEEKNKLHGQLINSEKMAAVGMLAAGIAHEINNPIGIILGFSQSVLKNVHENDILYMPLKSIEREAIRCKNLVNGLLTFSRASKTAIEAVDINNAIEDTMPLLSIKAKIQEIEIIKNYGQNLPYIVLNKNQIQQVIINLCNNAMDAMETLSQPGKIIISTKQNQDNIEISISDNGKGMSDEVKAHLFEPFFTTKEIGKGTGIGLSLCYEIIHKHSGTIEVSSKEGEGTTFTIKIPLKQI